MELSWFSMGIAGLEAAILIGLLAVLLSRKEHYRYVRGGLIQGFLVVIFLRLWLPWTFWDGREFFSPACQSLVGWIWLAGMMVQGVRYAIVSIQQRAWLRHLRTLYPLQRIAGCPYPVRMGERLEEPGVMGWEKTIYLPDLHWEPMELRCVLLHESAHLDHRDLWWLRFGNGLRIVYWWCPWMGRLGAQLEFFLETRVDQKVASSLAPDEYLIYAQVLLGMEKKLRKSSARGKAQQMSSYLWGLRMEQRLKRVLTAGSLALVLTLAFGFQGLESPAFDAYWVARADGTMWLIENGKVKERKPAERFFEQESDLPVVWERERGG